MTSEEVLSIRFGVDEANLLGSSNFPFLNWPASVQAYCDLCRRDLQDIFVNAEIEIVIDSQARVEINGDLSSSKADDVDQIKDNVYQACQWVVQYPYWDVENASKVFSIPVPIIQWACHEGLIPDVDAQSAVCKFTQESFLSLKANKAFSTCKEVARLSKDNEKYTIQESLPYDILNSPIEQISIDTIFLVLPAKFVRVPWFTGENFVLLISWRKLDIRVEIIQFFGINALSDMKWSPNTFAASIKRQVELYSSRLKKGISVETIDSLNRKRIDAIRYIFTINGQNNTDVLTGLISRTMDDMYNIAKEAEIDLTGGIQWEEIYERDEELFTLDVLRPLLWRMGFIKVDYIGGPREKGKDLVFSELNKFNELLYYGLQAKAGDISGRANGKVVKLIDQARDAFGYTYQGINDPSPIRISVFIIAISGTFTDEAKDKIRTSTHPRPGPIYFLDKERILELIKQYWSPKHTH